MGCNSSNSSNTKIEEAIEFDPASLIDTGMVQYFYHCPKSNLPIRDVSSRQKREPHIEIGAENFLDPCYQSNIKTFIDSNGKYLFLITTCRKKRVNYADEQLIVGYIIKEKAYKINGHFCVKGPTFICHFEEKGKKPIFVRKIFGRIFTPRGEKNKAFSLKHQAFIDKQTTKKILKSLKGRKNILKKCISEIKLLDENNNTCLKEKERCVFYETRDCSRWS